MSLSKVYLQTSNKPGLGILGKLSHQMSSASVVGNLYFHATRWWEMLSQGLMFSVDVSGVSKNLFPGVWRCDSQLATPDDSLFCKVEENLSGSVFPSRQSLQVTEMWCIRSPSPRSTLWKLLYQNIITLDRKNYTIEILYYCSFYHLWVKRGRSALGVWWLSQKFKSWWIPKS